MHLQISPTIRLDSNPINWPFCLLIIDIIHQFKNGISIAGKLKKGLCVTKKEELRVLTLKWNYY